MSVWGRESDRETRMLGNEAMTKGLLGDLSCRYSG